MALDGWQNRWDQPCTAVLTANSVWQARRGYSSVEIFSRKADAVFVAVLQKWRALLFRKNTLQIPASKRVAAVGM
jgi:hypothetical protein